MGEAPNTLCHGQAHSDPWEVTPEQSPHHDAAMPGADDGPTVSNPWADPALARPFPHGSAQCLWLGSSSWSTGSHSSVYFSQF